jgi:VWFA-related protein
MTMIGGEVRRAASLAVAVAIAASAAPDARQQPPVFKSGVELVVVDVQVVDQKGHPIAGMRPDQFEVSIDGKRRTVVSAQFVDAASGVAETGPAAASGSEAPAAPDAPIAPGTIYVLAVDQGSFRAINAPSAMHAVREFVTRLSPADYLGLITFPGPGLTIDPTRDRDLVLAAVPRVVGFASVKASRRFQFSLSDAIDVAARDGEARERVVRRNCQPGDMMCPQEVERELQEVVTNLDAQANMSLDGLRGAVQLVAGLPGRKTMVVVSAGIPSGDRTGGRVYVRPYAIDIGRAAANAGILLYTLHLNTKFLDAFSPDAPSAVQTLMRETGVYTRALEEFNGSAGGTFLEVNTGPDFAVERVIRETSKYYLLGVEPQDADRDGRPHAIKVKVKQRGSQVRNRATVVIPKPQGT